MPTYRNDSTSKAYQVTGISGEIIKLKPGLATETKYYYDESDLTKTADTPYYNPILLSTHVTAKDTEIDIKALAKSIEIINSSSTADASVYLNAAANTPAVFISSGSLPKRIENINALASKVIVTFSGETSLASGELVVNQWDQ